jgi:AraC-like DNA-binding protein
VPSPEASRRNLEKAKANWRPPRHWRSQQEAHVIRRMVWQWFTYRAPRKLSARAVARQLGISHTYVQKLVREFRTNPSEMQRQRAFGETTFGDLSQAQEITRQERARGHLRSRRPHKIAEFKVDDNVVRAFVGTTARTMPELEARASQTRGRGWGGARPGAGRKRKWKPLTGKWIIYGVDLEIDLEKEIRKFYRQCAAMPRIRAQITKSWPQFFYD